MPIPVTYAVSVAEYNIPVPLIPIATRGRTCGPIIAVLPPTTEYVLLLVVGKPVPPFGLLKYASTTPTDVDTVVPDVALKLTGVYVGFALKSVAEAVKVVLAVKPPVVLAGMNGIPLITPKVDKF